ncbi:tabersonine-19-hydroxy-O-acetyltransferase-like [Lycium barbarum]|uniref:tabersonine-19-hydroxy-O-acetyltransferase-like n=1 Tax=Lycium barbarum TaxID=112863 RepID=UPI00293E355A|nr:tabersonine-19-hydroxy-O-acetyltransferase-like [Lycium barbarum]
MERKVETISQDLIKPIVPQTCESYNLSALDQLVDFYPFAGRLINDNTSISCNSKDDDFGVVFIEAFAHNYNLQDILSNSDQTIKIANHFLPKLEDNSPASTTIVLLVQLTFLECGGMILGCSSSHKLEDVASFGAFVKCWAKATMLALGNKSCSLFSLIL